MPLKEEVSPPSIPICQRGGSLCPSKGEVWTVGTTRVFTSWYGFLERGRESEHATTPYDPNSFLFELGHFLESMHGTLASHHLVIGTQVAASGIGS